MLYFLRRTKGSDIKMKYNFDINNRAFKAIKNKTKRIEIRTTKLGENHFDYSVLKTDDIITFTSYDGETINCIVGDVNHYNSIEELLTLEGTRYTLSSTNNFEEGIKSINSINGYKEAIHGKNYWYQRWISGTQCCYKRVCS